MTKRTMKKFNLEAAKAGAKVCTRDGREVRITCFDAKSEYPIIALVMLDNKCEYPYSYTIDGFFDSDQEDNTPLDLFMSPTKHEGWMNLYQDNNLHGENVFETEEEAKQSKRLKNYVATAKIEWEE